MDLQNTPNHQPSYDQLHGSPALDQTNMQNFNMFNNQHFIDPIGNLHNINPAMLNNPNMALPAQYPGFMNFDMNQNMYMFPFNMDFCNFMEDENFNNIQNVNMNNKMGKKRQKSSNKNADQNNIGNPLQKKTTFKKPVILDNENKHTRFYGKLKFFSEEKGYGFIIMDNDQSDIFCHYDDFAKANITLDMLKGAKLGHILRLSYCCLSYIGRHNRSRKAVDLKVLEYHLN